MRFKLFALLLCFSFQSICQNQVYFLKDSAHTFAKENIALGSFQKLKKQILEQYSDDVYWFKIPSYPTNSEYVFKIVYERISGVEAYQNNKKLQKLKNQRFLSYQFNRENDVYIKVSPKLHAYIPVEFNNLETTILKENNHFLLNGFYYGFAFLVIIFNLFYYLLFKDDAFLYYALFLGSTSFGVFTMDGMLNYLNISDSLNNVIMILNYYCLAFFSSKFANSYLFLENYYPKLKRLSYALGIIIIISGLLYLNSKNYYYLLSVNILVFSLLIIYWFSSVLLFKKNVYTKILSFAFVIILFLGVDFFVLNFLGYSILHTNQNNIKIGAFIEMIILSIAVLYRMKTLKEENEFMTQEIINYSKLLNIKNKENKNKSITNNIDDLSVREREIFDLILMGKSNKEIATTVNISINTVKFHIKNIYEKLHIKSRKEAFNLSFH
ncbi:7TM diverse intracellular signaling domain-containing protein [Polaribacter sp. R77954]|uniref:7TM diverse intracellular signaling domain-containing protein n=1 Tax=Polaribacter sp. R77954 TaxID=3093870 RepID=UPI0037C9F9BE